MASVFTCQANCKETRVEINHCVRSVDIKLIHMNLSFDYGRTGQTKAHYSETFLLYFSRGKKKYIVYVYIHSSLHSP
jgi:hypothetical protein